MHSLSASQEWHLWLHPENEERPAQVATRHPLSWLHLSEEWPLSPLESCHGSAMWGVYWPLFSIHHNERLLSFNVISMGRFAHSKIIGKLRFKLFSFNIDGHHSRSMYHETISYVCNGTLQLKDCATVSMSLTSKTSARTKTWGNPQ